MRGDGGRQGVVLLRHSRRGTPGARLDRAVRDAVAERIADR
jgi:hypothetical protein